MTSMTFSLAFCRCVMFRTKDARKFMDKYKRLDAAMDAYYTDPSQFGGGSSKRVETDRTTRLNSLFDKYKGP